MVKYALLSVSDKTNIVYLAENLIKLGYTIISTGGTYKLLQDNQLKNIIEVADFTLFPEGLDGRVKTLTPQIFGGILNLRNNDDHKFFCQQNSIKNIDLVVVNLYPFKKTYDDPNKTFSEIVENIDIGGPSLIRAAAKNYEYCVPVVSPDDYVQIILELETNQELSLEYRKELSSKAFSMTAHYDLLIARFWKENSGEQLRYGENPHQSAVMITDPFVDGVNLVKSKILNGKALSYNNLSDASSALELCNSFTEPFAVIVKHNTPCGASNGTTIEEAFAKAYEADKTSAFGGIIAVNREVSAELAQHIISFFNEIVLAPKISEEALSIFKKKKNLRVLEIPEFMNKTKDICLKKIRGGTLIQDLDTHLVTSENYKTVTKKSPKDEELSDLIIAWNIVKIVKSNAIVLVKDGTMIGKGGGQTSRVEAVKIALEHAKNNSQRAVIASDAFFPFADSIEILSDAGISSVIQPGGSVKDKEVISTCDERNISMIFTGTRAFLH